MRTLFWKVSIGIFLSIAVVSYFWKPVLILLILLVPLFIIGIMDMRQTKQAIRRNFPIIGHGRYLLEIIRPEIYQYFIESNSDGKPFSREDRSVVYQRAKHE